MKYVLLAAGIGSRLLPETELLPKILVPVKNGKTTLDFQFHSIQLHSFVDEIIIVVGYKAELVKEHLDRFYSNYPIRVTIIHNSNYRETGPLYSLSLALDRIAGDDFMIVNGDVVYELSLLDIVPQLLLGCTLFVGTIASLDGDSLKVTLRGTQVLSVAKTIPVEKADGLSMGVFVVKGEAAIHQVLGVIRAESRRAPNSYWHAMVDILARQGKVTAYFDSIHTWQEIDNQVDLQYARQRSNLVYD